MEVQTRILHAECYHYLQINEVDNLRYTESLLESTSVPDTKGTARFLEWSQKREADVSKYLEIVNYSYALMERVNSNISSSALAHT